MKITVGGALIKDFSKSDMITVGSNSVAMSVAVDLKICNICSYVEVFRSSAKTKAHGYTIRTRNFTE